MEKTGKTIMQIVGVYFKGKGACEYDHLAKVWEFSAKKTHPEDNVILLELEVPLNSNTHEERNAYKFNSWNRIIQQTKEDTILMDVDTVLFDNISHVFEKDFDICYTTRKRISLPLNGGVIFVKSTDRSRKFFEEWQKIDKDLLENRRKYSKWIKEYNGQNQASFGYMIETYKDISLHTVPCEVYNACQEDWERIGKKTKVLHVKGDLKRLCSQSKSKKTLLDKYKKAYLAWKKIEKLYIDSIGAQIELLI